MNAVYVNGKRLTIDPAKTIGKGGEADVFSLGGDKVLKLYKPPEHLDYEGQPHEQQGARERLATHQNKLKMYPLPLPAQVIQPEQLATDAKGTIVGYVMPLVPKAEVLMRYEDRVFRQNNGLQNLAGALLRDLHTVVKAVHEAKVVIGDFNDLNILVDEGGKIALIDADSFQFANWLCRAFTARFVDPVLCDPKKSNLVLGKPHNPASDWYAFAVMVMLLELSVHPYGGVYRNAKDPVPHDARPLRRITVFNPLVKYPKPAVPLGLLPDELLGYFQQVFEKDVRGEFPVGLLERLNWSKCPSCQSEHARQACPNCQHPIPETVKATVTVRGKVTATRVFRTAGSIQYATVQHGQLYWLYHEQGEFRRESKAVVTTGSLAPNLRYRINKEQTLIGQYGTVVTLDPQKGRELTAVDQYGTLPMFDANGDRRYWAYGGQLWRDGEYGPEVVGSVLSDQTLFWAGPVFGFGFYRAGTLNVAFVFENKIKDTVQVPRVQGQLIDSSCVFAKDRCWFFTSSREGSKIVQRCTVVLRNGQIEATIAKEDAPWLAAIRGKFALGNSLFSATDEGIVRVDVANGQIGEAREFPDTEPFVHAGSYLFPAPQGIYVVNRQDITLLKL